MPICPQGHESTDGAFCDTCGRPLAAAPPIPVPSIPWAAAIRGDLPAHPPANGHPPFPPAGAPPQQPPGPRPNPITSITPPGRAVPLEDDQFPAVDTDAPGYAAPPANGPTAIPGLPTRRPANPQPGLAAYPLNLPPAPDDDPSTGFRAAFPADEPLSVPDLRRAAPGQDQPYGDGPSLPPRPH